jgi:hypothetical protein
MSENLKVRPRAKIHVQRIGHLLSNAHTISICGRGLQPDGRATGMGELEISEDGVRYPLVDFHRLAQRYGVAHQRLQSRRSELELHSGL